MIDTETLRVSFICTGNICRSPYAEALLRNIVRQEGWENRVDVRSRGLLDLQGAPAHEHTIQIGSQRGLNLLTHRSRIVDEEHLARCDLVLGMSTEHVHWLRERYPEHASKIFLLGAYPDPSATGEEIADPIGADLATFEDVCAKIQVALHPLTADLRRRLGGD